MLSCAYRRPILKLYPGGTSKGMYLNFLVFSITSIIWTIEANLALKVLVQHLHFRKGTKWFYLYYVRPAVPLHQRWLTCGSRAACRPRPSHMWRPSYFRGKQIIYRYYNFIIYSYINWQSFALVGTCPEAIPVNHHPCYIYIGYRSIDSVDVKRIN